MKNSMIIYFNKRNNGNVNLDFVDINKETAQAKILTIYSILSTDLQSSFFSKVLKVVGNTSSILLMLKVK